MNEISLVLVTIALSLIPVLLLVHIISYLPFFRFLYSRQGRLGAIDGLRGFLAFFVFIHHIVITWYWKETSAWSTPPEVSFDNIGKIGFATFFMITGYLFINKIIKDSGDTDWRALFRSRIFRIYPLYLFVVLIIFLISFINSSWQWSDGNIGNLINFIRWLAFHGTLVNGFSDTKNIIAGVHWTLRYEWFFYLTLPFISYLLIQCQKRFSIPFLLATCIIGFYFPIQIGSINTSFLIFFASGGIVAAMISNSMTLKKEIIHSPWASLLTITIFLFLLFYPHSFNTFHVVGLFFFFLLIAQGQDIFGLLNLRSSLLLGEISYSIYLTHGIILYLSITQFNFFEVSALSLQNFLLQSASALGIAVVIVSAITYLSIEKPGINIGKMIIRKEKQ